MVKGYIYKWINKKNGKCYIGQTINKKKRYSDFINSNRLYTSSSLNNLTKIDKARLKYGVEEFKYEIIEEIESGTKEQLIELLNNLEEKYIELYDSVNNGYNILKGGNNTIRSSEVCLYPFVFIDCSNFYKLKPKHILVYVFLCMNKYKDITYSTIANYFGIAINTVKSILTTLEKYGLIIIHKNITNTYEICKNKHPKLIPFFEKFISNIELTFNEKSYMASCFPYMCEDFIKQSHEEKIKELEEKDRERDELIKSQQKMLEMMQKEIDKLKAQQQNTFTI